MRAHHWKLWKSLQRNAAEIEQKKAELKEGGWYE